MFVTITNKTIELISGFGEKSSMAMLVPAPGLEPKSAIAIPFFLCMAYTDLE